MTICHVSVLLQYYLYYVKKLIIRLIKQYTIIRYNMCVLYAHEGDYKMDENNNNPNNGEGYVYEGGNTQSYVDPTNASAQGNVEYTAVPNNGASAEDGTTHPLNIISLVCGIYSIIGICVHYTTLYAWLFAIAAIILGAIGKKHSGAKLGKAGMICGIVGLSLFVLLLLLFAVGLAAIFGLAGMIGA